MDTLLEQKKLELPFKTYEFLITFIVLLLFVVANSVFYPNMFANDLIANTNATAPKLNDMTSALVDEINPQIKKEKFDARISQKYKGLTINNVSDGIKHIRLTRYYAGKPVKFNIVEINQSVAQNYEVRPEIASTTLPNKNTLTTIARKTNSIVAINGGFFKPQNGIPLGTIMINEKIYTGPIYNRVALGFFDDGYDVGRVQLNATITGNGKTIKIDNINQPRMLSSYTLMYTRAWGSYAPVSPQYGAQLQVVGNRITAASANPLFIPPNGYVLVGPKSQLSKLYGASFVDTQISTNPRWDNVKHIISGGPYLVRHGEVYVDATEQKLTGIVGKNPRTAIGYTKDNDLILVAVDGRENSSVGLTLVELAYFMKSLGCVNAINLDGGGSTVMYVNGKIVNNPQQYGGIALSNALVVSRKSNN